MQRKKSTVQSSRVIESPADNPVSLTLSPDRKPTINDIARLADVSKKTVSRVINESPFVRHETRARVNAIMVKVAFVPDAQARRLALRRSFLLGFVYDNPNAQYVINFQEGALGAIRRLGYELVVHPSDRRSESFLADVRQFVLRQKLDGVILVPPISEDLQLAQMLDDEHCHCVRVLSVAMDRPGDLVVSMDRHAASEVGEHLAKLGHTRIGFIAGPASFRSAHERFAGFSNTLADHGLTLPPQYIVEGVHTFESGFACAEALLSQNPQPTAIFACNDEMAAGVYKAAYTRGLKIPQDLSVVGFDDTPMASRLWPPLSTVRLPIRDMGRLAAEKLIAKIAGDPGHEATTTVYPHLVVRDSSTPPRT